MIDDFIGDAKYCVSTIKARRFFGAPLQLIYKIQAGKYIAALR